MAKWQSKMMKVLVAQNWLPEPLELEFLITEGPSRDPNEILMQVTVNMEMFKEQVERMRAMLLEFQESLPSTGLDSGDASVTEAMPHSVSEEPGEA